MFNQPEKRGTRWGNPEISDGWGEEKSKMAHHRWMMEQMQDQKGRNLTASTLASFWLKSTYTASVSEPLSVPTLHPGITSHWHQQEPWFFWHPYSDVFQYCVFIQFLFALWPWASHWKIRIFILSPNDVSNTNKVFYHKKKEWSRGESSKYLREHITELVTALEVGWLVLHLRGSLQRGKGDYCISK